MGRPHWLPYTECRPTRVNPIGMEPTVMLGHSERWRSRCSGRLVGLETRLRFQLQASGRRGGSQLTFDSQSRKKTRRFASFQASCYYEICCVPLVCYTVRARHERLRISQWILSYLSGCITQRRRCVINWMGRSQTNRAGWYPFTAS